MLTLQEYQTFYNVAAVEQSNSTELTVLTYFLLASCFHTYSPPYDYLHCSCLLLARQWFIQYQDKAIFRYQKLCLLLEPYHAPWLYCQISLMDWLILLLVHALLYLISVLNYSFDPHVDLMAVILVVGGLILLKGMTAKRVYKNWLHLMSWKLLSTSTWLLFQLSHCTT